MEDNIVVSIICNTYNHERFIRDALNGFVMQKTDFEFEVLVHDDASTDCTADIIREYEKRYPIIIKPIYQVTNQYSKGISISKTYQYPRVKGKYIAICEGDDYWTDPLKLQKQVDFMGKHPNVDICTHASMQVEALTGRVLSYITPAKDNCIIPTVEVIKGGGGFVSTNSIMIRTEILEKSPSFREKYSFDYTLQVFGALRGGMLYLADTMSVYRTNVPDSWIARMRKNRAAKIKHQKRMIQVFRQMNIDTKGEYFFTIVGLTIKAQMKIIGLKIGVKL